jgi:general secretion pathway protein K
LPDLPEHDWLPDGRPYRLTLFGAEVIVSVQDESGKLSLNMADQPTLSRAFANAGIDFTKAQSLAAAIADWRDPDDSRRLGGAERQDYQQAGISGSPANAPFRRVDELLGVLGVTDDVYRRIAPLVSAYSMDREVNLEVAPPAVLTALFGPGSAKIAENLGTRDSVPSDRESSKPSETSRRNDVPRHDGPTGPRTKTYTVFVTLEGAATPASTYYGAFQILRDHLGPRIAIVDNIELVGSMGSY